MSYVSDAIGDDYMKWNQGDSIIISFPTGTGKTYFVLNVLVPYAKKLNKKIVMFCNRVALYEQINNAIGEDNREYIELLTYQSAEYGIQKTISGDVLYYIFDEAHYIFQDSSFNEGTGEWYDQFFSTSKLSFGICIYLSATPDDVYLLLANKTKYCFNIDTYIEYYGKLTALYNKKQENENYYYYRHYITDDDYTINYTGKTPYTYGDKIYENILEHKNEFAKSYTQEICYDYLDCRYFNEYAELEKRIAESGDKWLIFVNKKSDGQKLCERLNELFLGTSKRAVFVSSQSKLRNDEANKELRNIEEKACFECDVLIATAILDNGVNIKDSKLKNIVISAYDKTEFIQMLGRRRVNEGDKVTLYIRYFSANVFSGLKRSIEKNIDFMMWFYEANTVKQSKLYANNTWYENRVHKPQEVQTTIFEKIKDGYAKGLLCRNKDYIKGRNDDVFRDFKINHIALMKQIALRYNYAKILQALKTDKLAFLKLQLSWLGKEYNEENWIDFEDKQIRIKEVKKHLETICGKYLNKTEQKELRRFLNSNICNNNSNLPGKTVLNRAISECGLDFVIVSKEIKRQTYWVVRERLYNINHSCFCDIDVL